jgi:hypothetical protein
MICNQTNLTLDDESGNLCPPVNHTELNTLKFQLPPHKLCRKRETGKTIGSLLGKQSHEHGLQDRRINDSDFNDCGVVKWRSTQVRSCCVAGNGATRLKTTAACTSPLTWIPTTFPSAVTLAFRSSLFEADKGHPMHLHGHNFALWKLFDVTLKVVDAIWVHPAVGRLHRLILTCAILGKASPFSQGVCGWSE